MGEGESLQKKTSSFMKSKKNVEAERQAALRKDIDIHEHKGPAEAVFTKFGHKDTDFETVLEKGLTSAVVEENRAKFGENRLKPPTVVPEWVKFLMQFANFFSLLLLGGGILCFIGFGIDENKDQTNLYLGVVLCFVVIVTSVFSYVQEAKSANIMEGFKNMIPKKCFVKRNGELVEIDAAELVAGDIVQLDDGQLVPADIRVLKSSGDLKVDNSSLTGESDPQDRMPGIHPEDGGSIMEATNVAFYTTIINSGKATGVVIGWGDHTVMGQIAGLTLETSQENSPIRKEINSFIGLVSGIAIFLGVTFFIVGVNLDPDIIKNIVFAIGIIVANVPEGLLLTVTVSLALTAKRMHSKNVLVKNLEAVETLGSTTVIASDKTGTLTQNRMTVQHCWYNDTIFATPTPKNEPEWKEMLAAGNVGPAPTDTYYDLNDETFKKLATVGLLCNNAKFLPPKDPKTDEPLPFNMKTDWPEKTFNLLGLDCKGDASESGLLKAVQPIRDAEEARSANEKVFEIPFNSTNKWQLSVHKKEGTNSLMMVMKGAPERVTKMCKYVLFKGQKLPWTQEWDDKFNAANEALGGLGERVLGFAYKDCTESADFSFQTKPTPNFAYDDLVFCGLFSLIDPPRPGVPEAVGICKTAGVKVFMVTGDHPITARAIARQVGIIDQDMLDCSPPKATVIKGDDIRDWLELDEAAQKAKWDWALSHRQIVFARVSPAHKLLIVENSQKRGEVVAVTGDGVNDAPALKKGDIGCAMGIAGKDVSKEAADMILMDDNFKSIVNGIEEGRIIFDNLKKSISYTLTSNIPEIGPFLVYTVGNIPLPLSTVLILCVDLGTDMVPAISLAYEGKESDIMLRAPRNSATDKLVNRKLITFAYLQIGMIQVLAGFFTYMVVLNDYGYPPWILEGIGVDTTWKTRSLMCTTNGDGAPKECGYGCADVPGDVYTANYGEVDWKADRDLQFCNMGGGCKIPGEGHGDPFTEFTSYGFRGFKEEFGNIWTCGRSCEYFTGAIGEDQSVVPYDPTNLEMALTEKEAKEMQKYCAAVSKAGFGTVLESGKASYRSREQDKANAAPEGSFYWWNGEKQLYPNPKFQRNALAHAQTSYFIGIIVVQWADLIISKTRKLSVFDQGMGNSFMNFGLCFETILGCCLIYIPFLCEVFTTRPLHILHWFTCVPFSLLIFLYDEVRKSLMRSNPGGFIETYTYW